MPFAPEQGAAWGLRDNLPQFVSDAVAEGSVRGNKETEIPPGRKPKEKNNPDSRPRYGQVAILSRLFQVSCCALNCRQWVEPVHLGWPN